MNPKNILLTGGHSGIGLELTKMLLKESDHQLGLVVRSEKRKASLPSELLDSSNIHFFYADLSDQNSVVQLVESVKAKWDRLDLLFNNAGVLLDRYYASKQGNEMHLEVNALAPHQLTLGLAPLFEKSDHPLVVNTLTGGMHNKKELKMGVFQAGAPYKKLLGSYMESKFALLLLSETWRNHLPGLRVLNVDPGPNKTKMTAGAGMPKLLLPIRNLLFPKPTKGAGLLYKAALDPIHQEVGFAYLSGNKKKNLKHQLGQEASSALLAGLQQ